MRQDASRITEIVDRLLKLTPFIKKLNAGSTASNGSLPRIYKLPRALPNAFRDLLLFLIFQSASLPPTKQQGDTATGSRTTTLSATSSFAQMQIQPTYKRCRSSLKRCRAEILSILSETKDLSKEIDFDMVTGEDISTLVYANLVNRLVTDQGDFLLTEIYTEYAMNLVCITVCVLLMV